MKERENFRGLSYSPESQQQDVIESMLPNAPRLDRDERKDLLLQSSVWIVEVEESLL